MRILPESDFTLTVWCWKLWIFIIYAFLSRNFLVAIYALVPPIFWAEKWTANFSAFIKYECDSMLTTRLSNLGNQVMFCYHSDKMSQKSKVSKIALWRCSLNVFVIVFVIVFVFAVVFLLVRSCFLITLIKCLKGQKSQRSLFEGIL